MRSTIFAVAFSAMSVLACGDDTPTGNGTPTVASVVVTPGNASLASLGETVQLTASARDASGNAIPGKTFTWSSSDASISTVSTSGLVTAVANGSATITATTDGVNGSAGVFFFDDAFGLSDQDFVERVSDHYLVFAVLDHGTGR